MSTIGISPETDLTLGSTSVGAPASSGMSMGAMSSVFGIAGAVNSIANTWFSSQNLKSSLQFQSRMAEINRRMSESSAQNELDIGRKRIAGLTLKAGQVKSSQRAAMAANGIDLSEGNAAEVQASTDLMKETDMNTIQQNAINNAWGYRIQGSNYGAEAAMRGAAANSVSPAGEAFGSMLTNANSVASGWYMRKLAGA